MVGTDLFGHFQTRPEAVRAYLAALRSAPAEPPPESRDIRSDYLGVRLLVSASNSTGYLGVRRVGAKFQAVASSRPNGVKKFVAIGTFKSAVLAAHAYSLHVSGAG